MKSDVKKSKRLQLNPINQRRWQGFKANRRGFWSLWIFLALFFVSLFAEFIANDKPILVYHGSKIYLPIFKDYPETTFGGEFETEADYRDPYVQELLKEKGFALWPLIPFADDTINYNLTVPAPAPPSAENWLGTDDQGRDIVARLIYGFRISVLFGIGSWHRFYGVFTENWLSYSNLLISPAMLPGLLHSFRGPSHIEGTHLARNSPTGIIVAI